MENLSNIVKQYSIKSNKRLGQNFIYDENILSKIAATQQDNNVCLEIGCGPGGLTKELAKACNNVIAIEIDKKFEPIYNEIFDEENIKIIFADFMKIDLKKLYDEYLKVPFSVCANLPYYITTPIMMKLLDSDLPINDITILVQKEVADRIVSQPNSKQYGVLSVMTQARSKAIKLFDLQPGVFYPPPNVVSSLIRLELKNDIIVSDINNFRKCVRACFSSRRKQLKNNISVLYDIKKDDVSKILEKIKINDQARAENLTVNDFDLLTQQLIKY